MMLKPSVHGYFGAVKVVRLLCLNAQSYLLALVGLGVETLSMSLILTLTLMPNFLSEHVKS
ncbi:hypothetical protein EMIT0232MI5_30164 [Pseudomonas sp. IT-232MI5]